MPLIFVRRGGLSQSISVNPCKFKGQNGSRASPLDPDRGRAGIDRSDVNCHFTDL
jgi:hypothetical protein